jgi:hypothetical protein
MSPPRMSARPMRPPPTPSRARRRAIPSRHRRVPAAVSDRHAHPRRSVDAHAAAARAPDGRAQHAARHAGHRDGALQPRRRLAHLHRAHPRALRRPRGARPTSRHTPRPRSRRGRQRHRPLRPRPTPAASPSSPRWTPTAAAAPPTAPRPHHPPAGAAPLRRPRTSSPSARRAHPRRAPLPAASPGFVALRDRTPSTDPRIEAARPRLRGGVQLPRGAGRMRDDLHLAFAYHRREPSATCSGPSSPCARRCSAAPRSPGRAPLHHRARAGRPQPQRRAHRHRHLHPAQLARRAQHPHLRRRRQRDAPAEAPVVPLHHGHPRAGAYGERARCRSLVISATACSAAARSTSRATSARADPAPRRGARLVVVATDWIGLSGGDRELIIRAGGAQHQPHHPRDRPAAPVARQQPRARPSSPSAPLSATCGCGFGMGPPHRPGARVLLRRQPRGHPGVVAVLGVAPHLARGARRCRGRRGPTSCRARRCTRPSRPSSTRLYPDPLLQAQFLALLQHRFDHTDGVNLATLAFRDPLPDAPPGRRIILQEAIGDCQVPNFATRILANEHPTRLPPRQRRPSLGFADGAGAHRRHPRAASAVWP